MSKPRLDVELLTSAEVAEILRVSGATVRRWARAGKLPGVVVVAGNVRFRRDAIEALLAPEQS